MILSTFFRNLTYVALTSCCLAGVAEAQTYSLTDLGVLPKQKLNTLVTPAAINEKTQVTGNSGTSAFRYTGTKGTMEDLGNNPEGSISRGFGINKFGEVVGDSTFGKAGVNHAVIFGDGFTRELGAETRAYPFSRANGINALGQVVGFSSEKHDGNNSRAFILSTVTRTGMIDLGTLGGTYAQAWGVNDSGFVTGNSQTADLSRPTPIHAFIWNPLARMVDLGTLGGRFSYGTAINAKGHVAGYSSINARDERMHAFLYDGEKMLDLGSLSGAAIETDFSFALGVNSSDQVVGYSYSPMGPAKESTDVVLGPWSVAFLYRNGLMVDLNTLIGPSSLNYRLDSATAINDKGEIVAVAFDSTTNAFHAVLLTPNAGPISPIGSP